MEQAVWLAFGVIAVVLGFAIVANLITTNKQEVRYGKFLEAVDRLKYQCDFVCDSPLDTYLAAELDLPSGLRLYTSQSRICGHLNISDQYSDETKCAICKCTVSMPAEFNLQTEVARQAFDLHKYSCYFLRKENEIEMECKG